MHILDVDNNNLANNVCIQRRSQRIGIADRTTLESKFERYT
jgi:hypothetical protein